MTPYNTDIARALKWMDNKAPIMQSLFSQKVDWYQKNHWTYWDNVQANILDLRTANAFGLTIWCIILGIPTDQFNFVTATNAWGFGPNRGNFVSQGNAVPLPFVTGKPDITSSGAAVSSDEFTYDSDTGDVTFSSAPAAGQVLAWTGDLQVSTYQVLSIKQARAIGTGDGTKTVFNILPSDAADFNATGDNFYGGGSSTVSNLEEIRYACMLRYVTLVSNGRQAWINKMLAYIFNDGLAWDISTGKYFYLTDESEYGTEPVVSSVTASNVGTLQPSQFTIDDSRPYATFVVFSSPPANGSALSWSGAVGGVTATNLLIGYGNGVSTRYPLSIPEGAQTPLTYDLVNAKIFVNDWQGNLQYSEVPRANQLLYSRVYSGLTYFQSYFSGFPSISGQIYEDASGGTKASAALVSDSTIPSSGVTGIYALSNDLLEGTPITVSALLRADVPFSASFGIQDGDTETIGVTTTWQKFTHNGLAPAPGNRMFQLTIWSGDVASLPSGSKIYFDEFSVVAGSESGPVIPATGSFVSGPDVTLDHTTGEAVFREPPHAAAGLTWSGRWKYGYASTPQAFGTGDGSTVEYQLTNPPGYSDVDDGGYAQYRIGANMGLSPQFVNLLADESMKLLPRAAGVKFEVIQE